MPTNWILNCDPSRDPHRNWGMAAAQRIIPGLASAGAPGAALDLRDQVEGWVIQDQGNTGSCVGWACADSVIGFQLRRAEILPPEKELSARYLWMAAKETDEDTERPTTFIEKAPTTLKAALAISRNYGLVTTEDIPFDGGDATGPRSGMFAGNIEEFYAVASRYRIDAYFDLGNTDFGAYRLWLQEVGPILLRIVVDGPFEQASGAANLATFDAASMKPGGHAVALVGWRADGTFILRNSWGTTWGERGYAYPTEAYLGMCVREAYGVKTPGALAAASPVARGPTGSCSARSA
jgi:hypothetical protein